MTEKDSRLARYCLEAARRHGASDARVTLTRSTEDLVATLDGEVDRITRCEDSSVSLALFVDGRYGTFSTNKLDEADLDDFIARAADIVRMLAPDPCRRLPDPDRCARDAVSGNELQTADPSYADITPEDRIRTALDACAWGRSEGEGWTLESEEGEYSDSLYEVLVLDTQGLECRHSETNCDYGVEVTIADSKGNRYSGYHWHSTPYRAELQWQDCGGRAVANAVAQIGSKPALSGRYNMVLDSDVASKAVSPVLNALAGYNLQQDNSFLRGTLGSKVFPEGLTLTDLPHVPRNSCSKLFDSEGVATRERKIIDRGVVSTYFLNTYMAGKTGLEPTCEEAVRPKVEPWPKPGLDRDAIMAMCGEGILVTEFNGGNCNVATGDFSYGVSGFLFKDGKIVRPVSEMLATGNFLTLWQGLLAAGDDARPCMSKLIPTLAFENVDFSG